MIKLVCVLFLGIFCRASITIAQQQGPPRFDCIKGLAADPFECCTLPELFDSKLKQSCIKSFMLNEPPKIPKPGSPPHGCCVSECLLNSTKILVNGKTINNAVAVTVLTKSVSAEWKPIIQNAINVCEKEINGIPSNSLPPSNLATKACQPISGAIIGCITKNLFMNCPNYNKNAKCAQLKTQIPQCLIALMKPANN